MNPPVTVELFRGRMKGQLLHQFTFGVLVLAPLFGTLPASAKDSPREGTCADQRVVYRRAPFDAPQLFVPNGHRVVNGVPVVASDGTAADVMMEVPAVGRNGGAPLKGFLTQ